MAARGIEQWKGKVAVVTGASAGIGAAVAEKLVNEGLMVAGLARRKDPMTILAKKLEGKEGKLYAVEADITKEEEVLKAFKWIRNSLGPIHILINNAGINRKTALIDGDTQKWKEILDTNVLGLCIATREAVKDMRTNNTHGCIVNVNSIAGHRVPNTPFINVYPASKYAVTALTETLRQELITQGTKIKVTSVSPGLTETELFEAMGSAVPSVSFKLLQSEDIADAILFILSTPPHVQIQDIIIRPQGYLL